MPIYTVGKHFLHTYQGSVMWEYHNCFVGKAQALFVLDCDIQRKGRGDFERWASTSYTKKDAHGYLAGGHARVIAAAHLAKCFPDPLIVTTSYYRPEDPVHAQVYRDELIRLGVPSSRIIMEVKSRSTIAELVEMVKLALVKSWEKVAILTSDYHLGRVMAIHQHLPELAERLSVGDQQFHEAWPWFQNQVMVSFLDAETVLLHRHLRYEGIVSAVRCSMAYRNRVEAEQRGVEQIRDGTYGKK